MRAKGPNTSSWEGDPRLLDGAAVDLSTIWARVTRGRAAWPRRPTRRMDWSPSQCRRGRARRVRNKQLADAGRTVRTFESRRYPPKSRSWRIQNQTACAVYFCCSQALTSLLR